jgi:HD-GYP domain-containing protein (c-di-GMP phosphodiesterase class II)
MLGTLEPDPFSPAEDFERIEARARAIAAQRTWRIDLPDAHARHVATLACDLARRIGLAAAQIGVIVEGALLHDVGKTLVPRAILAKRRPLDHVEYATVKMHPDWGFEIVGGDVSARAALAIRHHHEWWNGTGYPSRLVAQEIPLEARIVGIADAFAAMREKRPYRPARSKDEAVVELHRGAGEQFDPFLVEPLIASVESEGERPRLRLLPRLLFH